MHFSEFVKVAGKKKMSGRIVCQIIKVAMATIVCVALSSIF